jgi:hypothetical protein
VPSTWTPKCTGRAEGEIRTWPLFHISLVFSCSSLCSDCCHRCFGVVSEFVFDSFIPQLQPLGGSHQGQCARAASCAIGCAVGGSLLFRRFGNSSSFFRLWSYHLCRTYLIVHRVFYAVCDIYSRYPNWPYQTFIPSWKTPPLVGAPCIDHNYKYVVFCSLTSSAAEFLSHFSLSPPLSPLSLSLSLFLCLSPVCSLTTTLSDCHIVTAIAPLRLVGQ